MEVEAPSNVESQNGGKETVDESSDNIDSKSESGVNDAEGDKKEGSEKDKDDAEVETITDSPQKKSPSKKKEEASDEPLRRSSRKKTPTKYHELLIKEMESASEEEIE